MTLIISKSSIYNFLDERIGRALSHRFTSHASFTLEEANKVGDLTHRLFPENIHLSEDSIEQFRAISRLSRCGLESMSGFTSHRPLLGPVIVFVKRICWPFIFAQIKRPFLSLEDFNMLLIETLAKQQVELEHVKKVSHN